MAQPESTDPRGESQPPITAQRRSAAFEGVHPTGAPPIDPGPRRQQGFIHDPRRIRPSTDDLLERVRATGLLAAGGPVVVLLSGGRDSVCLLDVAVRLAGADAVSALHVNYGLRREAGDDEAQCRALCAEFGVALEVHVARRPEGPGNLQAWARDVRLGSGARIAAARGALLATGHTASDQAETVLYRLAASPGRRALLGMAERDGLLVRPLLGVTRAQTAAHCTARGLRWREDASNQDPAYARNRVRAGLLPALRELHPAAEGNVVRSAELLRDEAAVLDEVVETALAGRDTIAVEHLAALPPALARLVVRRLAEAAAGRLCARAAGRLPDILALGDGALDLGDGARAIVARGVLRVEPTPPGRAAPAARPETDPSSGTDPRPETDPSSGTDPRPVPTD